MAPKRRPNYSIRPSKSLHSSVAPGQPTPESHATLSWKYAEIGNKYCLSNCNKSEIKLALDTLRKVCQMTWIQIVQTGGRKNRTGLHATKYEDSDLQTIQRPNNLSEDIPIIGVRVSKKFRVFGVRKDNTFHLLWFDPNHKICPS